MDTIESISTMAPSQRSSWKLGRLILFTQLALCSLFFSSEPRNLLCGTAGQASSLVEVGSFVVDQPATPNTLKIVSYNVHGPLMGDFEEVHSVLKADLNLRDTHVWALQEVRTDKNRNFAREMAARLRIYYAHAIARPRGGGWEGLSILSRLPISDVERLELPHLDTGDRLRIGLFATISAGKQSIRLCNVHLPIRMSHEKRAEQLRLIFDSFNRHGVTARVLIGDFNTITSSLRKLYQLRLERHSFRTPFEGNAKTYQRFFFLRFKLDWIYLSGLKVLEQGIEQEITASDHRPVWVRVQTPK